MCFKHGKTYIDGKKHFFAKIEHKFQTFSNFVISTNSEESHTTVRSVNVILERASQAVGVYLGIRVNCILPAIVGCI